MKRGGVNAIFTPKSGVGKVVTLEALIELMASRYAGHTFFLGVEDEHYLQSGMALAIPRVRLDRPSVIAVCEGW